MPVITQEMLNDLNSQFGSEVAFYFAWVGMSFLTHLHSPRVDRIRF